MSDSPLLVLGTYNRKKAGELAELLAPHGLELQSLWEFPDAGEVAEEGDSFAANARLKATHQARCLRKWVLAEDSGLSVDALYGAPGIYSARYCGEGASDDANNRRLLAELGDLPLEQRAAHYVCHLTLADPAGRVRADCEAYCHGRIRRQPAGKSGFGYDPLFEIVEYHRTFAELGGAVKSVLSHRSRAVRRLLLQLLSLIRSDQWRRG